MNNEEFKKKRDSRTEDLIYQIQRHDDTIANIVKSAYERGYADGNYHRDFTVVSYTCEARCSCCGDLLKPNDGTIIAGRCRTYILCSDCDKRKDEFIKWSDEE